jgi:hypothetical protein
MRTTSEDVEGANSRRSREMAVIFTMIGARWPPALWTDGQTGSAATRCVWTAAACVPESSDRTKGSSGAARGPIADLEVHRAM